ncbi:hypothetical protein GCM10010398_73420 [Streptomyces fimbriatus]
MEKWQRAVPPPERSRRLVIRAPERDETPVQPCSEAVRERPWQTGIDGLALPLPADGAARSRIRASGHVSFMVVTSPLFSITPDGRRRCPGHGGPGLLRPPQYRQPSETCGTV